MNVLEADFTAPRGDLVLEASLTVQRGETVALVGPNGAGKSSILHVLTGLVPISSGSVMMDSVFWDDAPKDVHIPTHRRDLAVLFQDLRLFPHLNVRDNIAFGLRARGRLEQDISSQVDEVLERFELISKGRSRPKELSGGEQQLVALARAVVCRPSLLLLDEPTASLDNSMRPKVRRILRDVLADQSRANLIVTHEPVDALNLADRVIVVEGGRSGENGPIEEIARRPHSRYAASFVGLNLLRGQLSLAGDHAEVKTELGPLYVADPAIDEGSEVACVFHPNAVTLGIGPPASSARNVFPLEVVAVYAMGGRVRIDLGSLTAEVTPSAVDELGLRAGTQVWASVKATQIEVY